ncbi:MAG: energy-coupling factor transporter ATPase [Methanoregulaceae archaeon]|nr:energy-coupling factor transporter ATPase [Methanoregulaceae archaeon]
MIELESVRYGYPHTKNDAIKDVTLKVGQGTCVMVTGPSGAGKTTLCLAAAGILAHEYGGRKGGTVTIDGRNVNEFKDLSELASRIGVVFDDPDAQLIFTTVEEEILSALERRGLSADEIEERLRTVMEITHLSALKDRAPHTLSGGQKQRVVLATTLALGTDILILDEPTSELDEHGTTSILGILKDLKARGRTILLVEHKFQRMQEIVDTLIVMEGGSIRAKGQPADLLGDPGIRQIVVPDFAGIRQNGRAAGAGPVPVISLDRLSHSYGDIPALTDVSLSISPGEFVAIVGENGSGKTTLIKHFNGLLRPTAGTVSVRGKDTSGATITELAHDVGLVFQNPDHMFFADTVRDEVAFGPANLGIQDLETVIDRALGKVRLLPAKGLYPRWLSRGERQRLAIACVVAMNPAIIVLDEPTTGLDGKEAREVMEVLKDLQLEGHTVIIVTHSKEIARDVADRVVTMERGRVISDQAVPEGS